MRTPSQDPVSLYVEELYGRVTGFGDAADPVLEAIRGRLVAAGRWGVNIGPNEGRILQLLVRLSGARRAVEIGALYGYSAVWLARALPEGGRLFTLERDPACVAATRLAIEEARLGDRVTLLEGDALEALRMLSRDSSQDEPFDFVFIDANKSAYPEYLDWAEASVRSGGVIVADNVFLGGAVALAAKPAAMSEKQWRGMRVFNERLADPRKFQSVILPTGEGLSVAIKI